MNSPNPYDSPEPDLLRPEGPCHRPAFVRFLPSFFSGAASVLMLFLALSGMRDNEIPTFMFTPGFIGTLTACSTLSALILWPLHRTHWVVRSLLAIPLTILLFIAGMVVLRYFKI